MKYQDYLEIMPGKRSGKPCIINTRITVYDVLGMLANGMDSQEIIEDFPELKGEHIQACLAYAAEREHHVKTVEAV
ncbi:MAG: hypothetical protein ACI8WB_004759 [Phenylobacterium sp.]|jgi:uncharacterized protein (DUF433 family)